MIHARFFYRDLFRHPDGRITAALTLLTATGEKALFSISASRVALGESFGYLIRVERITTPGEYNASRTEERPFPPILRRQEHGG
jgi:hypothetical protein